MSRATRWTLGVATVVGATLMALLIPFGSEERPTTSWPESEYAERPEVLGILERSLVDDVTVQDHRFADRRARGSDRPGP